MISIDIEININSIIPKRFVFGICGVEMPNNNYDLWVDNYYYVIYIIIIM